MDLEEAREFKERCTQCAAVSWGLTDEGKYYCTSCHNVTEISKEVLNTGAIPNTKIQAINRGLKKKRKLEKGWDWYVCEGFQHILCQQAEALKNLGVRPELKNEVLHNFWKRYLQRSKQAYCKNSIYARRRRAVVLEDSLSQSDWENEPELLSDLSIPSLVESGAESQPDGPTRKPVPSIGASHSETASVCSGSLDGVEYSHRKEKGVVKMSVPGTLAFCFLSLLWQRETMTLSDLLRFVEEDHIPYIKAFEHFPEEMKLYGRDKGIFAIESWPTYEDIYKKAIEIATFLDLPRFPEITEDSYLHPNILCMKYLMEVNLPDEMHNFTCQVVKMTGTGEVDFLTFDPIAKVAKTVKYDVQAVAIIVVVLKLLFLLDDNLEWSLSDVAEKYNEKNKEDKPWFDFRKWYQVMKKSVDEKKQKWEEARAKETPDPREKIVQGSTTKLLLHKAGGLPPDMKTVSGCQVYSSPLCLSDFSTLCRYLWKSERPLYYSAIDKSVVYKRREMVVNLQKQFSTLVDSTPTVGKKNPSSFQFNWREEEPGKMCFHGHSLQGILKKKGQSLTTKNPLYWLSTQKFCKRNRTALVRKTVFPPERAFKIVKVKTRKEETQALPLTWAVWPPPAWSRSQSSYCKHVTTYEESNFSLSYQFILNLFSFLLRIKTSFLHEEVSLIEKRLFKTRYSKAKKKSSRSRK